MSGVVYLHGLVPAPALADALDADMPALPGWNDTPLDGFDDVDDYVFWLLDVLDELALERPVLVGDSFGGWLAAELAVRHPDRIGLLVLISPLGLRVDGCSPPPFFGAVAPRGIGGFGEARRLLFADPDGPVALATLPDDLDRDRQLAWFGGLAGAARLGWDAPHFQSRKLTSRLGRITCPTLVLVGEHDQLVPAPLADAWVRGIPDATLRTHPDAGHALSVEHTDWVVAQLSPPD